MNDTTSLRSPLSRIPAGIDSAQDYEALARQFIAEPTYAYISGGSAHNETVQANRGAFAHWSICPRLLGKFSDARTRVSVPGGSFEHPILLAPVAFQALVHEQAELESARAAAAVSAGLVVSTLSSRRLEDIAAAAGPERWFQLYLQPRQQDTLSLLRRAESSGYRAIVLTLDAVLQVPSFRARAMGFRVPAHCSAGNLVDLPGAALNPEPAVAASGILGGMLESAPRWTDLDFVLGSTSLPVWVKGVLHEDDALMLKARGVAGLVVSNHGGRSLDGAPASLQMLPSIRRAVGDDFPLLLDSGIRSGADVFKAIALGADAVLVGRLQLYASAVAGALGIAHMIKMLREELEVCMAHSGCASLAAIRAARLVTRRVADVSLRDPRC